MTLYPTFARRLIIPALLLIITSGIYVYSLCPTVYLIDSGELAAVSYTLGIAHPTGYPLYTLISHFFAHLPGEPIRNLNLLSAIFSILATIFLYFTVIKITEHKPTAVLIALLYALSPTIWRTSITNEVYPFTGLFSVLLLYLFFNLKDSRIYYAIMFFIGLSFTNHIIIFSLVAPLSLYIVFINKPGIKKFLVGLIIAGIGLSIYLYLLFRTIGGAELAWGNTVNLQRLIWHITGRQYQVWMFSLSVGEILNNAKQGINFIAKDLLYVFIVFVVTGFYWLFKNNKRQFWLFLLIFLLNYFYTINYAIPDIEPYYIPGFVSLLFVCGYGLNIFRKYIQWYILIPVAIVILLINYPVCTLKNNTFGLDYALLHIAQLPEKSLLLCSYWDIYSPTIYLRKVKNFRRDLMVIDKELLRRTWYIKYLKNEYPDFCSLAEKEINDYLVELLKFEYGRPYDPNVIQTKYIKMLEKFVEVKESNDVFFALPFPDYDLNNVKPDYLRIPCGLNYLVTRQPVPALFDFSSLQMNFPEYVNDPRLKYNIDFVKKMVINNINYLSRTNRKEEADKVKKWSEHLLLKK